MPPQQSPAPLTPNQQRTVTLARWLQPQLEFTTLSAAQVALSRHLTAHGIEHRCVQASVGNDNRKAGTQYLVVEGLKISLMGPVGDRPITKAAFSRFDLGRLPAWYRFEELEFGSHSPWWSDEHERYASRLQAQLEQHELEASTPSPSSARFRGGPRL